MSFSVDLLRVYDSHTYAISILQTADARFKSRHYDICLLLT